MGLFLNRRNPLIPPDAGGGWLMAGVIAALAFVACLALSAATGASRAVAGWTEGLAAAAMARVSSLEPGVEARTETALKLILATPGVKEAHILKPDETAGLLKDWFDKGVDLDALPTPRLIAVTVDKAKPPQPSLIQSTLDGAGLHAVYDDHKIWRDRAASAARAVRLSAFAAMGAAGLAMLAAIVSAVKGAMGGQRHIIAALRLAGAEDRFVARIYQNRFLVLGLAGGAVGALLAAGALELFGGLSELAGVKGLEALRPQWRPLGALAVAAGAALTAMIAARLAAFSALRKET